MKQAFLIVLLIASILTSCKREQDEVPSPFNEALNYPVSCITDCNIGIDLATDIVGIIDIAYSTGAYSSCAVVNIDSSLWYDPDTVEVDFGSSNCLDSDGHNRRGRVVCLYQEGFMDSLNVKQIYFFDYYVDDIKINGIIDVENNGHDASGNTSHSIYTGGISFQKNGDDMYFNSNLLYVRSIGESTPSFLDDVWSVTGLSANCNTFNGKTFNFNITSPLYRAEQCKYITKGTVLISPQGSEQSSLDYGNGGCDNSATYILDGNSYSLVLD